MEPSKSEIPMFFPDKEQMVLYFTQNISSFTHRKRVVQNTSLYYHIHCYNEACQFQIKYTFKTKNCDILFPDKGFFVHKDSDIRHSSGCKCDTNTTKYSSTPSGMAALIAPLYEDDPKVTKETIRHFLFTLFQEELEESRIKYIRDLAKKSIRGNRSQFLATIVEIVKNLEKQGWNISIIYEEGFISSVRIIPPWSENLIKFYYSPLITDATFTSEKLNFYALRIIDGEKSLHTVVILIRAFEDFHGYSQMFEFARQHIPSGAHVTIISDMGKPIKKGVQFNFVSNYSHMY
jgi:hypothetical protein